MKTQPTTDRGRSTLARILDSACLLFARQGIRATTLDQVGQLAKVGRGQLYHFFTDKRDLVDSVVAQQVERVLEAQQPLLGSLDGAADLREWCASAIELLRGSDDPIRCPIGTLVYELAEDDPLARATLAAGFQRWRAALAAGFHRAAERGELITDADPDGLAVGLLSAYQGGMLLAHALDDIEVLRLALAAATEPAFTERATARSQLSAGERER